MSLIRQLAYSTFAIGFVSLTACAADVSQASNEEAAQSNEAITGGSLVASNVYPFNAVVRWARPDGEWCTGTKIGPRRILTAAHCLYTHLQSGDAIHVANDLDTTTWPANSTYTVDTVHVYPSYAKTPAQFGQSHYRAYDVALVDVTTNLPAAWPTIGIHDEYVDAGVSGITVGYGCDLDNASHEKKKQRETFTSTSLANLKSRSSADDTTDYGIYTYNVVYDGGQHSETCPGDSGGPQLLDVGNGVYEVIATTVSHPEHLSRQERIGNVVRWIRAPEQDVFADGEIGMFLNGKSNLCIGVPGASTAADTQLAQYFCDDRKHEKDDQTWSLKGIGSGYFVIKNGKSGKCIGVDGGSTATGARIAQYDCDSSPTIHENQAWTFADNGGGRYRIVNGKSGKCFGVDGATTDIDGHISLYPCDGAANQGWNFVR